MIGIKRDNLGGQQLSGSLPQEVSGTGQNRVVEPRRSPRHQKWLVPASQPIPRETIAARNVADCSEHNDSSHDDVEPLCLIVA